MQLWQDNNFWQDIILGLPLPQVLLTLLFESRAMLVSGSWQTLLPKVRATLEEKSLCQVLTASRCTCVSVSEPCTSARHYSLSHSLYYQELCSQPLLWRQLVSWSLHVMTSPCWGEGAQVSNDWGAVVSIRQRRGGTEMVNAKLCICSGSWNKLKGKL